MSTPFDTLRNPNDISRMIRVAAQRGARTITAAEADFAWDAASDAEGALWMPLPDDDAVLFAQLQRRIPGL